MTAVCPSCGTRFNLPPRSKLKSTQALRCSRCDHVFPFDEAVEEPMLLDEPAEDFRLDDAEDEGDDDAADDGAPRRKRRPARKAAPEEAGPAQTSAPLFAVRATLGVTIAYAVFSIYLYTHPTRVRALVGDIPVVGERLTETHLGPESIQLAEVKGDYRRVQSDALVFVVSGIAINNSPVPVRGVQIKGRVVGAREDSVIVFCGVQAHDVEKYSVPELNMLQSLERPPTGWTLGPGQQAPFAIVFTSPPPALREFTAEVAAVQRTLHRGPADERASS